MGRYFNLQAQVLVLLLLLGFEIISTFWPLGAGWTLVVDLGCLFSILHLGGGYVFYFLRHLRRLRMLMADWAAGSGGWRTIAVLREILTWVAMAFLALWMSRWSRGWEAGWSLKGAEHYRNYLDAAGWALVLAWVLSWRRVARRLMQIDLTSGRRMLLLYLFATLVGTVFLILPFSLQPDDNLPLVDALFITVSALSVTGLSTVNVAEVLSLPGQAILLILIQIGGLGIVVLTAALAATTFKRLSLEAALVGRELYDIPAIGNMSRFLSRVVGFTLASEFVGAGILYASLPAEMPNRVFHAVFHAVSAFCNAGFSTLPANLEASPFGFMGLGTICFLVVVGGLGFPVIFEILIRTRPARHWQGLSAHARMTLIMTGALLLGGSGVIFSLETFSPRSALEPLERLGQAVFYAISTRTAGFNMVPVAEFGQTTVLVLMFLMAIGGSPMSTAGGIKTTSVGVLIAAAISTLRGHQWIQFRNREIPVTTLMRAATALVLYVFLGGMAALTLIFSESLDAWHLIFEVISALSTVGLSLNVTEHLTPFGKILVAILMFLGRVGIATVIYAGLGRRTYQRYRYPKDRFFTG